MLHNLTKQNNKKMKMTLKQWQEKVPSCSSHFPKLPQGANEQRRGGRGLLVIAMILNMLVVMLLVTISIIVITTFVNSPSPPITTTIILITLGFTINNHHDADNC